MDDRSLSYEGSLSRIPKLGGRCVFIWRSLDNHLLNGNVVQVAFAVRESDRRDNRDPQFAWKHRIPGEPRNHLVHVSEGLVN